LIYDATLDGRTLRVEVRASGAGRYRLRLDGRPVEVDVQDAGPHAMSLIAAGRAYDAVVDGREGAYRVVLRGQAVEVSLVEASRAAVAARKAAGGPARVQAPMPGKLVRVLVRAGEDVGERDPRAAGGSGEGSAGAGGPGRGNRRPPRPPGVNLPLPSGPP
jgi:biotin carboxyl carrier protein